MLDIDLMPISELGINGMVMYPMLSWYQPMFHRVVFGDQYFPLFP